MLLFIIFAWVDPFIFQNVVFYITGSSVICLLKKKVPVVYISILSVNSEYMPSNVCKVFLCLYRDIECMYELSFCFIFHENSEFKLSLYFVIVTITNRIMWFFINTCILINTFYLVKTEFIKKNK